MMRKRCPSFFQTLPIVFNFVAHDFFKPWATFFCNVVINHGFTIVIDVLWVNIETFLTIFIFAHIRSILLFCGIIHE